MSSMPSTGIERRCREDIAFRVIADNEFPDHATIARFRERHESAINGLFAALIVIGEPTLEKGLDKGVSKADKIVKPQPIGQHSIVDSATGFSWFMCHR